MFKMQETTVSDADSDQVRVEFHVSEKRDLEQSSQYVACSVLVSIEPVAPDTRPISFGVLQTRALKAAIVLLGQVDDERMPK